MNKKEQGEFLPIEKLIVNLNSLSDEELDKFIVDITFTAQKKTQHVDTSLALAREFLFAATVEKNSRSATKQAKAAEKLAMASLIVAFVIGIISLFK